MRSTLRTVTAKPSSSTADPRGRNLRLASATALIGFIVLWVGYQHIFGNDRLGTLPWRDLSARVGVLRFPHGTTRLLPGPKTFALYLREHGSTRSPPRVDFHRNDVVLVAVGPRSTTGYTLRVLSVVEQRRRIVVTLREETPTLGAPVSVQARYPYSLIAFPKTGKHAFLHIEGRP